MTDLDQSGNRLQATKVYLGPSIGWVTVFVKPERTISAAGTYAVNVGDSIIFVTTTAAVTLTLPSVEDWLNAGLNFFPGTAFEGALWVKDLSGDRTIPITIDPDGLDEIDGLNQNFTIVQNRQLIRLYPMADRSGWFSG